MELRSAPLRVTYVSARSHPKNVMWQASSQGPFHYQLLTSDKRIQLRQFGDSFEGKLSYQKPYIVSIGDMKLRTEDIAVKVSLVRSTELGVSSPGDHLQFIEVARNAIG